MIEVSAVSIALTIGLGIIVHRASVRFSIPGGRIVLMVFAMGLLNLFGISIRIPQWIPFPAGLIIGTVFGLRINRDHVRNILRLLPACIVLVVLYVVITWCYAFVLENVADLDRNTALVSVIPGGIAEAGLIALAFGADVAIVTAFQMTRFLAIMGFIPLLSGPLRRYFVADSGMVHDPATDSSGTNRMGLREGNILQHTVFRLSALAVGASGAIVMHWVAFPAASLVGPLLFVGVLKSTDRWKPASIPNWLFCGAQVAMGASIGSTFTSDRMAEFGSLLVPTIILALLIIGSSFLLGAVFAKVYRWPLVAGFLAVVPGGLTPVMLMADDLGLDVASISTLQTVRLLTAVLLIPITYRMAF